MVKAKKKITKKPTERRLKRTIEEKQTKITRRKLILQSSKEGNETLSRTPAAQSTALEEEELSAKGYTRKEIEDIEAKLRRIQTDQPPNTSTIAALTIRPTAPEVESSTTALIPISIAGMELVGVEVGYPSIALEVWARTITTIGATDEGAIQVALQTIQLIEAKVAEHKTRTYELLGKPEKEAMIQEFIRKNKLPLKRKSKATAQRPKLIPSNIESILMELK
ncbi:hypothetical protein Droror1_Dr00000161 [Drosera rotundifolia]